MKKTMFLLMIICSMFTVKAAHKDTLTMADSANNVLWSNPLNWSSGTVPTSSDTVYLTSQGGSKSPTVDVDVVAKVLIVESSYTRALSFAGRKVSVANRLMIDGTGTLNTGDTLYISDIGQIHIGSGVGTVTGTATVVYTDGQLDTIDFDKNISMKQQIVGDGDTCDTRGSGLPSFINTNYPLVMKNNGLLKWTTRAAYQITGNGKFIDITGTPMFVNNATTSPRFDIGANNLNDTIPAMTIVGTGIGLSFSTQNVASGYTIHLGGNFNNTAGKTYIQGLTTAGTFKSNGYSINATGLHFGASGAGRMTTIWGSSVVTVDSVNTAFTGYNASAQTDSFQTSTWNVKNVTMGDLHSAIKGTSKWNITGVSKLLSAGVIWADTVICNPGQGNTVSLGDSLNCGYFDLDNGNFDFNSFNLRTASSQIFGNDSTDTLKNTGNGSITATITGNGNMFFMGNTGHPYYDAGTNVDSVWGYLNNLNIDLQGNDSLKSGYAHVYLHNITGAYNGKKMVIGGNPGHGNAWILMRDGIFTGQSGGTLFIVSRLLNQCYTVTNPWQFNGCVLSGVGDWYLYQQVWRGITVNIPTVNAPGSILQFTSQSSEVGAGFLVTGDSVICAYLGSRKDPAVDASIHMSDAYIRATVSATFYSLSSTGKFRAYFDTCKLRTPKLVLNHVSDRGTVAYFGSSSDTITDSLNIGLYCIVDTTTKLAEIINNSTLKVKGHNELLPYFKVKNLMCLDSFRLTNLSVVDSGEVTLLSNSGLVCDSVTKVVGSIDKLVRFVSSIPGVAANWWVKAYTSTYTYFKDIYSKQETINATSNTNVDGTGNININFSTPIVGIPVFSPNSFTILGGQRCTVTVTSGFIGACSTKVKFVEGTFSSWIPLNVINFSSAWFIVPYNRMTGVTSDSLKNGDSQKAYKATGYSYTSTHSDFVLMGDSRMEAVNQDTFVYYRGTGQTCHNYAFSGSTLASVIAALPTKLTQNTPHYVIIQSAFNDIILGRSKEQYISDLDSILKLCTAANCSLVISTLIPSYRIYAQAGQYSYYQEQWAKNKSNVFISDAYYRNLETDHTLAKEQLYYSKYQIDGIHPSSIIESPETQSGTTALAKQLTTFSKITDDKIIFGKYGFPNPQYLSWSLWQFSGSSINDNLDTGAVISNNLTDISTSPVVCIGDGVNYNKVSISSLSGATLQYRMLNVAFFTFDDTSWCKWYNYTDTIRTTNNWLQIRTIGIDTINDITINYTPIQNTDTIKTSWNLKSYDITINKGFVPETRSNFPYRIALPITDTVFWKTLNPQRSNIAIVGSDNVMRKRFIEDADSGAGLLVIRADLSDDSSTSKAYRVVVGDSIIDYNNNYGITASNNYINYLSIPFSDSGIYLKDNSNIFSLVRFNTFGTSSRLLRKQSGPVYRSYKFTGTVPYIRSNIAGAVFYNKMGAFNITKSDPFTFTTIIKRDSTGKRMTVFGNHDGLRGIDFRFMENDSFEISFGDDTSGTKEMRIAWPANTSLNWQMITVTYNGNIDSSGINCYYNKTLQPKRTISNTLNNAVYVYPASNTNRFGERYYNSQNIMNFKGSMGGTDIYFKSLTQNDVTTMYNNVFNRDSTISISNMNTYPRAITGTQNIRPNRIEISGGTKCTLTVANGLYDPCSLKIYNNGSWSQYIKVNVVNSSKGWFIAPAGVAGIVNDSLKNGDNVVSYKSRAFTYVASTIEFNRGHYNSYNQKYHVISNFDEGLSEWNKLNDTLVVDTNKLHTTSGATGLQFRTTVAGDVGAKKYNCIIPDSLKWFYFQFYTEDISKMNGAQVWIAEDSANTKYFNKTIVYNFASSHSGFIKTMVHKEQFGSTGSPSWANVKHILVKLASSPGNKISATMNTIRMFNPKGKPNIIFTFDDGLKSTYNGFHILDDRGIDATCFINGAYVGQSLTGSYGTDTVMTLEQLHELQDSGWDIGSHSWSHKRLDTTGINESLDEIKTNYDYLVNNNFKGYDLFAYPRGAYGPIANGFIDKYHSFARTIFTQRITDSSFLGVPNQMYSDKNINIIGIGTETTVNQILVEVDSCISKGTTAIFCFHHIGTYPNSVINNFISAEDLANLADSLIVRKNAGKCNIKSLGQFLNTYQRY